MFIFRVSLCLPLCLLLCACASVEHKPLPTEAELIVMAKKIPTQADINQRFKELPGILREICTAQELAPYFSKTPCLANMPTAAQLADRSKITPEQMQAMQKAVDEIQTLNAETRRLMIDSQLEPYVSEARSALEISDPLVRDNQRQLLDGQITWGQYNQRRQQLCSPQDAH